VTTTDPTDWPAPLRAALESPPLERKAWQSSLATQLIGLFLWVAFFDQVPAETLGRCRLLWPVAGAGIGGLLSYLLLYRPPALWGHRTGRPLAVVAARTFGVRGATWVPGLPLALVQVVWLAVAVQYGTALCLLGLELIGLLDPGYHRGLRLGAVNLPGPLFLFTALLWSFAAAFTGRYLVRVIAALMNVYPILPALLLGTTAAVAMRGLPEYQAAMSGLGDRTGGTAAGVAVALVAAQMVFGFFSSSALLCADWGAVLRGERDVKLGGWVGVVLASWVVATLSLLCVAGAFPRYGLPVPVGPGSWRALTFTESVRSLVGGKTAGFMLIGFGLTALAPACYASFLLGDRLNLIRPRVSRTRWTIVGALLAWLLVASGLVARLLPVFEVVGAVFAPALGAIAADYVRSRGRWTGARLGWSGPGLLAWLVGVVLGLTPVLGGLLGARRLANLQPAAVFAFAAAFLTYLVLGTLGSETAVVELESVTEPTGPEPVSG
jgi:hypothetical protein